MQFVVFLIFFPFAAALLMLCMKKPSAARTAVSICCSMIIIAAVIALAVCAWTDNHVLPGSHAGAENLFLTDPRIPNMLVMLGELFLMGAVFYYGIRYKKYYVLLLSAGGTLPVVWLDVTGKSEAASLAQNMHYIRIDNLTVMMCLVVGIVGGLICCYANGYIRDYHHHHTDYPERSAWFLAMLFVFLGAMFGLLLSDNLGWIFFFWEVTSVCSFLLIGYNKLPQSIANSFKALWMNLLGGLGFTVAILYCTLQLHMTNLSQITADTSAAGKALVMLPAACLAFAALTKSAQMPFNGWLLGAMVAPTPTSALLHSATMVKAGVYLLLRLGPVMADTLPGYMVMTIGGFTFFAASLMAIATSDGKRVLAHSTVSNLGLIAACAGVGRPESIWAGMMLILFHAVSKSLMFLCVGAVENATGSRNIEDMHGLIVRAPKIASAMIIGICGMCLAPFGMLVAKWAALKSFVDANNIALILFLAFGSATTTFYWTKWLGKLFAVLHHTERVPDDRFEKTEWLAIIPLSSLIILMMFLFSVISRNIIQPVLHQMFVGKQIADVIDSGDATIMIIMLILLAMVPLFARVMNRIREEEKDKEVLTYMNGVNAGDDRHFINSYGEAQPLYLANWYITQWFGELVLMKPCLVISAAAVTIFMILAIGGGF